MTRPSLALALLALAGCAGPAPRDPDPPLAHAAAIESSSAASVGTGPYTVERAVARALAANPDVAIAERRVEQALAGTREASAAFLPGLDARLGWTRTDDPLAAFGFLLRQRAYSPTLDPNRPGDQQDVRPDIVVQWNLFRGGADLEHRAAALEGEEAARAGGEATRNALASAAAEAFHTLAKAQDLVPVASDSVRAVDAALADARARESVGKALAGDVLSLEARRAEAKDVLVRATNGVALARATLRALLALPSDAPLEIAPDTGDPTTPLPDEGSAIVRALEARPELRAARAFAAGLEHEATAAGREANPLLPRVDAFASYGIDSNNLRFNGNADNWTVGVLVDLNIFAGGRDRARAQRAEARHGEALEDERKAALAVELDVRRALLAAQEARERVATAAEGLEAAVEAHRVVQEQFHAGTVTVTRYLEAEVALRDARARQVVARADERIAGAQLARAMGDGAHAHWSGR